MIWVKPIEELFQVSRQIGTQSFFLLKPLKFASNVTNGYKVRKREIKLHWKLQIRRDIDPSLYESLGNDYIIFEKNISLTSSTLKV